MTNNAFSIKLGEIVIVVIMLISFISDGASWKAIETLLALGILAFLFFNWLGK